MASELNGLNFQRVKINEQAALSSDGRTIVKALTIDGISYDIDIDFSKDDFAYKELEMIRKIQMIWAHMARQALPTSSSIPTNWQMQCSYDSNSEKASVVVISSGYPENKSDTISFPAEQLREDLRESLQFIKDYSPSGKIFTVHHVMKYVDSVMHHSSYDLDRSMIARSKEIRAETRRRRKASPPKEESFKSEASSTLPQGSYGLDEEAVDGFVPADSST